MTGWVAAAAATAATGWVVSGVAKCVRERRRSDACVERRRCVRRVDDEKLRLGTCRPSTRGLHAVLCT